MINPFEPLIFFSKSKCNRDSSRTLFRNEIFREQQNREAAVVAVPCGENLKRKDIEDSAFTVQQRTAWHWNCYMTWNSSQELQQSLSPLPSSFLTFFQSLFACPTFSASLTHFFSSVTLILHVLYSICLSLSLLSALLRLHTDRQYHTGRQTNHMVCFLSCVAESGFSSPLYTAVCSAWVC